MLAVAVLSLLASALASLCVTHIRLTSRLDRGRLASNAARSVASDAVAKILADPEFGVQRLATQQLVYGNSEATGLVSFDSVSAADAGVRLSTNNLQGSSDAAGDGGSLVPAGTVEICAVGRSGGAERRVEVVLRLPPFPWAIASGGKIETQNGVLVAAVPAGVWPPPTEEKDLLPANLLANGDEPRSVFLGDNSLVLGDVETPGGVVLGLNSVTVRGEILSGVAPVEIPDINPEEHDPEMTGVSHLDIREGDIREVVGTTRAGADIVFPDRLKLSNGTLYVDGDLELRGGVEGHGALIATGDIAITAGAQIDGLTELAVISGGRVSLRGRARERSMIRGLFYAREGLEATELTLTGSLVTGSASTGVSLDRVNVLFEEPGIRTEQETTEQVLGGRFTVFSQSRGGPRGTGGAAQQTYRVVRPGEAGSGNPAFYFEVIPTNGGYPVRLVFTPGSEPNVSSLDTILQSPEDWQRLEPALASSTSIPPQFLPLLLQSMVSAVVATGGPEDPGEPQPSIVLYGDISRFLPLEDRVRVVSWVER